MTNTGQTVNNFGDKSLGKKTIDDVINQTILPKDPILKDNQTNTGSRAREGILKNPFKSASTPVGSIVVDDPINSKSLPIDTIGVNDQTNTGSRAARGGILKNPTKSASTPVGSIVVDDLTNKKMTEGSVSPPTGLSTNTSSTSAKGCPTVSFVFAIITIIPILQLIIGWIYSNNCPLNWRIPNYLIVAGIIGIIIGVLFAVQYVLVLISMCKRDMSQSAHVATGCVCCVTLITFVFLCTFYVCWFIAGCIWVFRAWGKVQYIDKDKNNYCNSTLYRFAFWLLLISVLYQASICFYGCFQVNNLVKKKGKGGAIPVPTSEP